MLLRCSRDPLDAHSPSGALTRTAGDVPDMPGAWYRAQHSGSARRSMARRAVLFGVVFGYRAGGCSAPLQGARAPRGASARAVLGGAHGGRRAHAARATRRASPDIGGDPCSVDGCAMPVYDAVVRLRPMLQVSDVAVASRWYQEVLGLTSGHGGDEFEMLLSGDEFVLQLHRLDAHEHGFVQPSAGETRGAGRRCGSRPRIDPRSMRCSTAPSPRGQPSSSDRIGIRKHITTRQRWSMLTGTSW